ncbi:MAG: outer membrane protein transport protein [Xanthomonadales bacterium]|nr:outer membrane protein transport protein [Xanthomonadales bacterium]
MQLKNQTRLFAAITTLLLTTPLWATNGYYTHGIGTKNKGMAGAGLAMPEDAISVANNPAAALASAGKYDLGLALFSPSRHYETSTSQANGQCSPMGCAFTIGPNSIDSDKNYFFIPNMAGAWQIDDKSAWSAAFYGRGGMNTTWNGGSATFDPDGPGPAPTMTLPGTYGAGLFGGNGTAGVDLSQAFIEFGYAREFGGNFTLGISLIGVAQVFAGRGVSTFGAYTETFAASGGMTMPSNLSNNGHDQSYGLGGKVGLLWDLNEKVSFAASYQPEIGMSKLDDYSDLFADHGNMDIPSDLKAGITFRPNQGFALSFDIEKIWYSDVPSVNNPFSNLFACPTAGAGGTDLSSCLGGKNGAGFGWQDMTVYKVGAQWSAGEDWTWRAGYSHGDQPIPDSEVVFNILAPGVIEDHATIGFTHALPSGNEYSLSFMYAFNKEISGTNPLDPSQTITMDMDQFELEFSFGWRR